MKACLQDLENIRMDRIKTGLTDLATKVTEEAVGAVKVSNKYSSQLFCMFFIFYDLYVVYAIIINYVYIHILLCNNS